MLLFHGTCGSAAVDGALTAVGAELARSHADQRSQGTKNSQDLVCNAFALGLSHRRPINAHYMRCIWG